MGQAHRFHPPATRGRLTMAATYPMTKANRSRRHWLIVLASAPLPGSQVLAKAGAWQRRSAISTGTAMHWLKTELLPSRRQRQEAARTIAA